MEMVAAAIAAHHSATRYTAQSIARKHRAREAHDDKASATEDKSNKIRSLNQRYKTHTHTHTHPHTH